MIISLFDFGTTRLRDYGAFIRLAVSQTRSLAVLLILILAKFGQHAEGRFRVQEGDAQALGALARGLVDKADAQFLGLFQVAFDVLDAEGDVVHAAAPVVVLDELGDGAFGAGGLQKFDFGLAAAQESGLHFLVGDFFDGVALGAKQFFKERNGLVQARDGDSNVFNVRWLHNYSNNLMLKNTYCEFTVQRYDNFWGNAKIKHQNNC